MKTVNTPAVKSVNLTKASEQWATRPDDQRFWDLNEMAAATARFKENCVVFDAQLNGVNFNGDTKSLFIESTKTKRNVSLSHYAFGQVCRSLGAPAEYMRSLPAPIVAQALNHHRVNADNVTKTLCLLAERTATPHVRAMTSDRYTRIWNADVVKQLLPLQEKGWRTPPARPSSHAGRTRIATKADVLSIGAGGGQQVKIGDTIAPAGLYASEKDMFAFLINEKNPVKNTNGLPLYRGFFIENSEVGDRAFKITMFLFNGVCGNHIVWGAEDVNEIVYRHIGNADARASETMQREMSVYIDKSAKEAERMITLASKFIIESDENKIADALFAKRIPMLTRQNIEASLVEAKAHPEDYGEKIDWRSAWAVSQGMTRLSQRLPHADSRVALDRAATKVLELVPLN